MTRFGVPAPPLSRGVYMQMYNNMETTTISGDIGIMIAFIAVFIRDVLVFTTILFYSKICVYAINNGHFPNYWYAPLFTPFIALPDHVFSDRQPKSPASMTKVSKVTTTPDARMSIKTAPMDEEAAQEPEGVTFSRISSEEDIKERAPLRVATGFALVPQVNQRSYLDLLHLGSPSEEWRLHLIPILFMVTYASFVSISMTRSVYDSTGDNSF